MHIYMLAFLYISIELQIYICVLTYIYALANVLINVALHFYKKHALLQKCKDKSDFITALECLPLRLGRRSFYPQNSRLRVR